MTDPSPPAPALVPPDVVATDEAARARAALASMPGILFEIELPSGSVRWVSENVERLSGVPRELVLGDPQRWRDFLHPEDLAAVRRAVGDAGAQGRWDVEFRLRHPNGRWYWFRSTGQLAPLAEGAPADAPRLAHGLAMLDEAQHRVRVRERTYRELVTAASRSLVTDEVFVHVVEAARELLGADRATVWVPDAEGARLRNVAQAGSAAIPMLDVACDDDTSLVARVFRSGAAEQVEDYTTAPTAHADRLRPNDAGPVLAVAGEADGEPAVVLAMSRHRGRPRFSSRDVEDAVHLATQAGFAIATARRYRAALDASRAKSSFLSTLGHELRTPIGTIDGFAELVAVEGPVTERQRDYLQRIRRASAHLLHLVDDLFDLTRIEQGRARLSPRRFDGRDPLAHAGELLRDAAEAKGLALRLTPGDTPAWAHADPDRVRQILVNLLGNAVKFTEQGEVRAWCEQGGGRAYWFVRDDGVGIPLDLHERIFEPFFQVREGASRGASGAGIGLAVSRSLARAMGGDLLVDSDAGRGSIFTLVLPAEPPAPPEPLRDAARSAAS